MNILSFLGKHKFTLGLFLYLFVIAYFQLHFSGAQKFENIIISLNALSLIVILHFISKCRRIPAMILNVLFVILITVEAYYGFFFKSIITVGIVASVMEATTDEAVFVIKEFALKFLILFCMALFLVFQSSKELKNTKISVKWGVMFLFIYLMIAFPLYVFRRVKKDEFFAGIYRDSPVLAVQIALSQKCPLMYGQVSSFVAYYGEKFQMDRYPQHVRKLPEGVFTNEQAVLPEKIFFVIGESACRNYMSSYGYVAQTTPFLDSLLQVSPGMLQYEGISPANITRNAVRLLLSFATPMNMRPFFTQKNLVELANDAGYQTIWISNQSNFGWHSNFASLIASVAHDSYFAGQEEVAIIDDLTLIPVLQEKYRKNTKQFFVIHLMGSHFDYADRSDEIDKIFFPDEDKFSKYNRSIHHTDRVMREIYHAINDNDSTSILFYVSDHGQCFEFLGSGFLNNTLTQFEVPMVVINQTQLNVDSIVNKYYLPGKTWINTLCSINILAELMGYSFTDEFVAHIREQGKYIYNVDSQVYSYEDLEQKSLK